MAVVYIWRIVEAAWFAEPASAEGAPDIDPPREAPVMMLIVTGVVALANVGFGLATGTQRELAERAAGALLGNLP